MKKTLVIVGHASYENSIYNKKLVEAIKDMENVTVHILKENFNTEAEQKLLTEYDNIVLQYPLYWFNTTPLLKSWMDKVFAYGYAYGPNGDKLENKNFKIAVTAAAPFEAYQPDGQNKATVEDLLLPMIRSLGFTRSNFKGSFSVHGCLAGSPNEISEEKLSQKAEEYKSFVSSF